jgi:hypothetical protein
MWNRYRTSSGAADRASMEPREKLKIPADAVKYKFDVEEIVGPCGGA